MGAVRSFAFFTKDPSSAVIEFDRFTLVSAAAEIAESGKNEKLEDEKLEDEQLEDGGFFSKARKGLMSLFGEDEE